MRLQMNLMLYSRSLRSYASYLFFLAFVEVTSTSALAATFQGIPNLDSATALSSNGQYVVGRSNGKGMRWSANAGAIPLYDAIGLGVDNPRGVSSDGRTVVGNTNKPAEGAYAPMIWVDGLLYSAPSSVTGSQGVTRWNTTLNAVSDDGFVVVGIEQGQNQWPAIENLIQML